VSDLNGSHVSEIRGVLLYSEFVLLKANSVSLSRPVEYECLTRARQREYIQRAASFQGFKQIREVSVMYQGISRKSGADTRKGVASVYSEDYDYDQEDMAASTPRTEPRKSERMRTESDGHGFSSSGAGEEEHADGKSFGDNMRRHSEHVLEYIGSLDRDQAEAGGSLAARFPGSRPASYSCGSGFSNHHYLADARFEDRAVSADNSRQSVGNSSPVLGRRKSSITKIFGKAKSWVKETRGSLSPVGLARNSRQVERVEQALWDSANNGVTGERCYCGSSGTVIMF
jgi:hypothetical protein